jgi:hypothetical protein
MNHPLRAFAFLFLTVLFLFSGVFTAPGAHADDFSGVEAAVASGKYGLHELKTRRLSRRLLTGLSSAMDEQVNIWGDTILEGDFISEGSTRLDRVQAVEDPASHALVAYRITYSEKAWAMEACEYADTGRLDGCKPGRISEASFVSPDLKSWITDDRFMADFRN